MTTRKHYFIYLIPFLLVFGVLFFSFKTESHASEPVASTASAGTALPSFQVPSLFQPEKNFTEKDLQGKVVLLNIWSVSCGFCRKEHDFLLEIKRDYHVPIYGLVIKDDPAIAKSWLANSGNPYENVGIDTAGDVSMSLGMSGTPQTFIIDSHGMVRYQIIGMLDKTTWDEKIYPIIQQLKGESH